MKDGLNNFLTWKTVRFIPTEPKGEEIIYNDLCHEDTIFKILILCILFTSSSKLCFVAPTLYLDHKGSRENECHFRQEEVMTCVGGGRGEGGTSHQTEEEN